MTAAWLSAFVNGLILSAILPFVILLTFRWIGPRLWNASTRYAVWFVALVITILLPLLYAPIRPLKIFERLSGSSVDPENRTSSTATIRTGASDGPSTSATSTSVFRAASHLFPIEIPTGSWTRWAVWAWLFTSSFLLLRLVASCFLLQRRKARARSAQLGRETAERWLARCGSNRKIGLAVCDEVSTPVAAGPFRPYILIPSQLFQALNNEDLEQIGLHEAAHFARRDDYALLVQRICEAIFVFHPIVHFITRRMELEREIACDDFVIELTGRTQAYAECLTRIVELANSTTISPLVASATQTRSVLEKRLDVLLDPNRRAGVRVLKTRLAASLVLLGLVLTAASANPQFVVFATPPDISIADVQEKPSVDAAVAPPSLTKSPSKLPRVSLELSVHSEPEAQAQQSSLALVIVVDKSGSMGGPDSTAPKIDAAKEAARIALDLIKADQWFGVLVFNNDVDWAVPLQRATDKSRMRASIDRIAAAGETSIYPALREAHTALSRIPAATKHIFLVSDGRSLPGDYRTIFDEMNRQAISLSTVALGSAADRRLLSTLADWGHGRSYFINVSSKLPEVFAREVQIVQGEGSPATVPHPSFDAIPDKVADSEFDARSIQSEPSLPAGYVTACASADRWCVLMKHSLKGLIATAYQAFASNGVEIPRRLLDQIVVGAPDWAGPGRLFDVEVRSDDDSGITEDQLYSMLRSLLADRFKLKFHRENRLVPGYVLFADTVEEHSRDYGLPFSTLTRSFASILNAPILDKTGFMGLYRVTIPAGRDPVTLSTSLQEQVGVRLEPRLVAIEVLVIDSVERPTGK
jgi:beta-lactamase regulating signal transducer with metallopeptidase domain